MERTFSHSGDLGDLIAHLPVVRAKGGGRLVLTQTACTGRRMTPERAAAVAPLLERQRYVTGVEWAETPAGLDLDVWRGTYRVGMNLTDMACWCFNVYAPPRAEPWLEADPTRVAAVVFARSPRCRDPEFPWRRAWEMYHTRAVFVGLSDEHAAFEAEVGPVAYHPTADYLALAGVIGGADLFVGNQSSPLWVAEGLKQRVLVETLRAADNCRWQRPGAVYGVGTASRLPEDV